MEDALHADGGGGEGGGEEGGGEGVVGGGEGGGCREGGGAPAAALCVKAAGELPLLHHQLYESFNTDTEGKLMLFQLLLVLPPMCQSNLKVDPESNR